MEEKPSPWKCWTGYTCRTGASVLSEPRDGPPPSLLGRGKCHPPTARPTAPHFIVEMRRARLVSHLLVLQHVLVIAQPPGGGGGDINCVDGQQATGDASKIGKGTALLGAIACTDPAAVTVRSCPT